MTTECSGKPFECQPLGKREVRASFDGGTITSDGGGLLLREVEKRTGIVERFAACFTDHRDAERIEHTVQQLVAQRVYGLALGYEDLGSASADSPAKLKRRVRRVLTVTEKYPPGEVCPARVASPGHAERTGHRTRVRVSRRSQTPYF